MKKLPLVATLGAIGIAVAKELRKPIAERTWNGTLGGVVPYDLRPPTPRRIKARIWAPDNRRLIVPQVFGIGWTVNAGRVVELVRRGGKAS